MINKNATRTYSTTQEEYIAKLLGGRRSPNSGAGNFIKNDVNIPSASVAIECKTAMSDKESFSIKKEWIETAEKDMKLNHLSNYMVAFNFGPSYSEKENYFIINQKLAKYLIEKLTEDLK